MAQMMIKNNKEHGYSTCGFQIVMITSELHKVIVPYRDLNVCQKQSELVWLQAVIGKNWTKEIGFHFIIVNSCILIKCNYKKLILLRVNYYILLL